jgi:hypothetical protein
MFPTVVRTLMSISDPGTNQQIDRVLHTLSLLSCTIDFLLHLFSSLSLTLHVPYLSHQPTMPSSKRREAATGYLRAFETWDIDKVLSRYLTKTCTHQIAPASVGQAIGILNNAQWATRVRSLKGIIKSCCFVVKEIVEDEPENKLVLWVDGRITFSDEDVGVFNGEYMFILEFEEGGERVERVVEFVDSREVAGRFLGMVEEGRRAAEREKTTEGPEERGKAGVARTVRSTD